MILYKKLFVLYMLVFSAGVVSAAPIVPGDFSTTWDTGDGFTASINLGSCGDNGIEYYWEEIGNDTNNGSGMCSTDEITITFPGAGQYRIDFDETSPGLITSINLGTQSNKDKFRSVEQWGDAQWTSLAAAFAQVPVLAINATDAPDLSLATSLNGAFAFTSDFNSDISHWDVSTIENMQDLFFGAAAFDQPLNSWDVSSVTNMGAMFRDAVSFNQPLNSWDVSSVTSMGSMFHGATSFNQNLSTWNVTNVTQLGFMFSNAAVFDQDLSAWDVANKSGYSLYGMFDNAALSTQNYSNMLTAWSVLSLQSGVDLGAVGPTATPTQYCDTAQAAKDIIVGTYSWTIADGGVVNCTSPEVAPTGGTQSTAVGKRQERLQDLQNDVVDTTEPTTATVSSFVASLKNLLTYLVANEEEIAELTAAERASVIIVLRDALLRLVALLPGV